MAPKFFQNYNFHSITKILCKILFFVKQNPRQITIHPGFHFEGGVTEISFQVIFSQNAVHAFLKLVRSGYNQTNLGRQFSTILNEPIRFVLKILCILIFFNPLYLRVKMRK